MLKSCISNFFLCCRNKAQIFKNSKMIYIKKLENAFFKNSSVKKTSAQANGPNSTYNGASFQTLLVPDKNNLHLLQNTQSTASSSAVGGQRGGRLHSLEKRRGSLSALPPHPFLLATTTLSSANTQVCFKRYFRI